MVAARRPSLEAVVLALPQTKVGQVVPPQTPAGQAGQAGHLRRRKTVVLVAVAGPLMVAWVVGRGDVSAQLVLSVSVV